ncbi:MAG: sensor histidine kinase [Cytobacillus gottheilii]|uniref:sensor histidine kinase n=1 Tax=Cytobacillus gottheilii TaxID=859144 RepID=UPI00082CF280|nr:sensor histidine kinase [Cytobacillus gottheilii]
MAKKYIAFLKNPGISPYIWILLSILPFYFIFQSSSTYEIAVGILLTITFFIVYRFAFISDRWPVYLWSSILIAISMTMAILFHYIYFAIFIASYNGNIKNKVAFYTIYVAHLVVTTAAINFNIVIGEQLFLTQLPFIIIIWISVILLPFTISNKHKQEKLERELAYANKRISDLVKQEERQRIARDLHDTLGQKLSLIGLKSDLARRLIYKNPEQAREELKDVQQTARTALNEVRKMVSQMRGIRLKEELVSVKQLLKAAEIEYIGSDALKVVNVSLFIENILSMCLKEAVTNVVKHSKASYCKIKIIQTEKEIKIIVEDNGVGFDPTEHETKGNGLIGMKERLDFVNGTLDIHSNAGTTVTMSVPTVLRAVEQEGKEI